MMRTYLLMASILVLAFSNMVEGYPQAPQSLPFKPGQSVYIVALNGNSGPDFATEGVLKREFEKQKAFKIATSPQTADFVFVMYVDYGVKSDGNREFMSVYEYVKGVTVLAVSTDTYTRSKSDPYTLRDEALWKVGGGQSIFAAPWESFPFRDIVKGFHENMGVYRNMSRK